MGHATKQEMTAIKNANDQLNALNNSPLYFSISMDPD